MTLSGAPPLVIAHRGASGDRPENTLPAFEEAIAQGADVIETDLHLSRDGVVVIHHDASLERLGEPDWAGCYLKHLVQASADSLPRLLMTKSDLHVCIIFLARGELHRIFECNI